MDCIVIGMEPNGLGDDGVKFEVIGSSTQNRKILTAILSVEDWANTRVNDGLELSFAIPAGEPEGVQARIIARFRMREMNELKRCDMEVVLEDIHVERSDYSSLDLKLAVRRIGGNGSWLVKEVISMAIQDSFTIEGIDSDGEWSSLVQPPNHNMAFEVRVEYSGGFEYKTHLIRKQHEEAELRMTDVYKSMFERGEECDVIIKSLDGQYIRAHSIILKSSSDFFRSEVRFKRTDECKENSPLHIDSMYTGDILRALIRFMYSGVLENLDLTDRSVLCELIDGSSYYRLQGLSELLGAHCLSAWKDDGSVANIVVLRTLGLHNLKEAEMDYFGKVKESIAYIREPGELLSLFGLPLDSQLGNDVDAKFLIELWEFTLRVYNNNNNDPLDGRVFEGLSLLANTRREALQWSLMDAIKNVVAGLNTPEEFFKFFGFGGIE